LSQGINLLVSSFVLRHLTQFFLTQRNVDANVIVRIFVNVGFIQIDSYVAGAHAEKATYIHDNSFNFTFRCHQYVFYISHTFIVGAIDIRTLQVVRGDEIRCYPLISFLRFYFCGPMSTHAISGALTTFIRFQQVLGLYTLFGLLITIRFLRDLALIISLSIAAILICGALTTFIRFQQDLGLFTSLFRETILISFLLFLVHVTVRECGTQTQ